MCLRFQFCTHQRVCILHFLKKSQIRCTLMHIAYLMQLFKNKCSLKNFQMIGLIDGVRLYNDLHMKPLAPRLTLYIAQVSGDIWLTLMQRWGSVTFWC
jgi:hypothetical protein